MKKLLFALFLLFMVVSAFPQVAINTTGNAPDSKAMLDVSSTTAGILIPRMTTTQRNNISPAAAQEGLTVYDTDTKSFWFYDGSDWVEIRKGGQDWSLTGNAGTTVGTNFLGTTDDVSLSFKTNNTERMRILNTGEVGIGTTSPGYPLTVTSATASRTGSFINTETNTDNYAVYGQCSQSDYYGYGGYFRGGYKGLQAVVYPSGSSYYYGLYGYVSGGSGVNYGVYGRSYGSGTKYGVYGYSSGSGTNYGVLGYGSSYGGFFSSSNVGAYGRATNTGSGYYYGVRGYVSGGSGHNRAIYGYSTGSGYQAGSYGYATGSGYSYGVYGYANGSDDNFGVYGYVADNNGFAIYGNNQDEDGTGIMGIGDTISTFWYPTLGAGVVGNGDSLGVVGYGVDDGNNTWGGYFSATRHTNVYAYVGGVSSSGTVYKINGTGSVSTIVKRPDGTRANMFCPEAPEILLQDFGEGKLVNGKAHIDLDPIFANNITVNSKHPLRVIIQLEGDCNGVYVTNKTKNGFDVVELQGGKSNVPFTWFVTANRADSYDAKGKLVSKNADVRFPDGPGPLSSIKKKVDKNLVPHDEDLKNDTVPINEDPKNKDK